MQHMVPTSLLARSITPYQHTVTVVRDEVMPWTVPVEYNPPLAVCVSMHTTHVLEHREEKDQFFKLAPQSPLPEHDRHGFSGLSYFEPDEDLVFNIDLKTVESTNIQISTTTGDARTYKRVATATITVDGEDATIALYSSGHEGLFLPFRDATSGSETYGAGRYVDVIPNEDGTALIDFNYAYAPFCAYSDRYSCALPPQENWMSVAIRAGERNPD
jgi:uncharacterized protein (DUF1684 family)